MFQRSTYRPPAAKNARRIKLRLEPPLDGRLRRRDRLKHATAAIPAAHQRGVAMRGGGCHPDLRWRRRTAPPALGAAPARRYRYPALQPVTG